MMYSIATVAAEGSGSYDFISALVLAVIAAVVGGLVAYLLKQPLIIGYLLGGLLIGPHTPGPVTSVENVQILAEIGVALLMFGLGTEFSIQELKHVGKAAVVGGLLQIVLTIALGVPVGLLLGLSLTASIFLGGLIAISSSIVMIKLLMGRGELDSRQGKLALGVCIVQDLSLIALVVVLPALGGANGNNLLADLGVAALKAGLFLGGAYVVGTRVLPWCLERVAATGMREVFLLVVLAIALGMAFLAQLLQISFALGAFVAGLIISSSEIAGDVLNEIVPFRDLFSSLFFVSIGMLINPAFVWDNLGAVLLLVAAIVIGKWLIAGGLMRLLGQPFKTALLTGLLLAQVGEFSFVLAQIGVDKKAIPSSVEGLLLSAALVTIILNPVLLQITPLLADRVGRWRAQRQTAGELEAGIALPRTLGSPAAQALHAQTQRWPFANHVIVCGYGRVGREIVDICKARGFAVVVIDFDERRVEMAVQNGVIAFYGDATVEAMLKQANIEQAKVLAVAVPDVVVAETATELGRRFCPDLEIITRATEPRSVALLKRAGASEVVQPEFEAGLEFIRRTARAYGLGGVELQALVNSRRNQYYGQGD